MWAGCNPGMRASGMAFQAKGEVLERFGDGGQRVRVGKFVRVRAGEGFEKVSELMEEVSLVYPVVMKPDFGQRGQGVKVVKNEEEGKRWVEQCEEGFLVQEFVGGLEFGLHWSKGPGEERGRIDSLCGKHRQWVVGDGVKTLEELILGDDRAVLMWSYYSKKYEEDLGKVIGEGEEFVLAPIGTHSRGAVFTDERGLVTEELVRAFDEFGEKYEGFCFGRYDVKVGSEDDLKAGRGLVVLELNGVMGEPAHVYQPGYAWWRGMIDFVRHFRRAAEIGNLWRERGVEPPSLGELFGLVRRHCETDYLEIDE